MVINSVVGPFQGPIFFGFVTEGLRSLRSLRPSAKHGLPPSGALLPQRGAEVHAVGITAAEILIAQTYK